MADKIRKKGQISWVILIGIVFLIVIFIGLRAREEINHREQVEDATAADVKSYVEDCLEKVSGFGAYKIGLHGGKIDAELKRDMIETNYAYLDGKRFPSVEEMEFSLGNYVDENLRKCTNFNIFEDKTIRTMDDPKTDVTFTEEKVVVDTKFPLKITKGDAVSRIEDFSVTLDIRMLKIHQQVSKIIEEIAPNPKYIYLKDLHDSGFAFDVISYPDANIYFLKDYNSVLKGRNYDFVFAVS